MRNRYEDCSRGSPTHLDGGSGRVPNHFAVLAIPWRSQQEVIRTSRKRLLFLYDPDHLHSDAGRHATSLREGILVSWRVLGEPAQRARYLRECGRAFEWKGPRLGTQLSPVLPWWEAPREV